MDESGWSLHLPSQVIATLTASSLGKSVTLYDEVEVFWIATSEHPLPDADWMLKNFPSAAEIIRGICHGF